MSVFVKHWQWNRTPNWRYGVATRRRAISCLSFNDIPLIHHCWHKILSHLNPIRTFTICFSHIYFNYIGPFISQLHRHGILASLCTYEVIIIWRYVFPHCPMFICRRPQRVSYFEIPHHRLMQILRYYQQDTTCSAHTLFPHAINHISTPALFSPCFISWWYLVHHH
jgi:hypothetical protein